MELRPRRKTGKRGSTVGRKSEQKRATTAAEVANVATDSGVGKKGGEVVTKEIPRAYPPKRPGVFAIRHWPPNCGPRRGVEDDGVGGELQAAVAGDESLLEEEEEPEECDCCGFEDGEEDEGVGRRRRDDDGKKEQMQKEVKHEELERGVSEDDVGQPSIKKSRLFEVEEGIAEVDPEKKK